MHKILTVGLSLSSTAVLHLEAGEVGIGLHLFDERHLGDVVS
jgi:hypothetical protein